MFDISDYFGYFSKENIILKFLSLSSLIYFFSLSPEADLSFFFSFCSGSQVFVVPALLSSSSRMNVSAIEHLLSLSSSCHLTSRCCFSVSHGVPSALLFSPWRENAHDFRRVSFICLLFWAILTSDYV